jgi:hypothetical protein
MVSLSRLTLKTKFYLIVGAAAAGFAAIGITTYSAVRGARVDAPAMVSLLDSKDLRRCPPTTCKSARGLRRRS